jgi:hypothetical protein
MNVGTNTQTAKDILSRQKTPSVMSSNVKEKLPASGTTLLPNEIANLQKPLSSPTPAHAPKVFNEQGVSDDEPTPPTEVLDIVQKIDPSQKYINVGLSGMPEFEKVMLEEKIKNIEKSPWPLAIILIFILVMIGGFLYWWFFIFNAPSTEETESEKLLQEIQIQKEVDAQAQIPVEPTGPVDPFTNEVIQQ